jgi:hypothetical protein
VPRGVRPFNARDQQSSLLVLFVGVHLPAIKGFLHAVSLGSENIPLRPRRIRPVDELPVQSPSV